MTTANLAIITARGGSKRIPGKNIKEFCGKPMIHYSIEAALSSGIFQEVMVSTEDMQIADIARSCGAKVPFFRSQEAADDYASTDAVILEVLRAYETRGKHFDRFCCIYPTAPFLTGDLLAQAMHTLDHAASCMPVTPFSYPPQRGLILEEGKLKRAYPDFAAARSQDLPPIYHDCGQFYACHTDAFLEAGTTDVEDLVPILLSPMVVQDIDTPEDWALAELKYRTWRSQI